MTKSSDSNGIWEWDIVKYVTIASLLLFTGLLLMYGYTEVGVRQNIRWSARISFTLFVLAFGAAGLHGYFKNSLTWWLRMNRKYLGISFAIIHLVHLGFIGSLQLSFDPVFNQLDIISLLGGGIAYIFVVLMLLTSFESVSNYLSKLQWKLLHTIGGYWISIIFFAQYFGKRNEPVYWIFIIILLVIHFFRVKDYIKKKYSTA